MPDYAGGTDARRQEGAGKAPETSLRELITVPYESHPYPGDFQCALDPVAAIYLREEPAKCAAVGCGEFFVFPSRTRSHSIDGYYHLVASSILRGDVVGSDDKQMRPGQPSGVFTIAYIARHDLSEKGLGESLVIDAALRARATFRTLGLTLYANNRKLVEFYKKLGFKITRPAQRQMVYENNNPEEAQKPYYMYATYKKLIGS